MKREKRAALELRARTLEAQCAALRDREDDRGRQLEFALKCVREGLVKIANLETELERLVPRRNVRWIL